MSCEVRVDIPGQSYSVSIGAGLLKTVGDSVRAATDAEKIALITDETVAARYGMAVSSSLTNAGFHVFDFTVPAGEPSKNWMTAGNLLEELAAAGLGRTDCVLALGGGVVGDLAGFVAATYLRGIDFVQVPTTLLAMVDSSVGGKTGVDLSAGKNLAGAFKQPKAVIADTSTLVTLPESEWLSGLAEVAKSGVIEGEEFMAWLESNAGRLLARDEAVVDEAVRRCVSFKSAVVSRDETEEGPRECLNYGHTLGHAIEKVAGYGVVSHGAAVAEGMRFASRVAVQLAGADKRFVKRQDALLDALGLAPLDVSLKSASIVDAMRSDKKARAGSVRFVLADAPGSWRCEAVPESVLYDHVNAWVATKGSEQE